MIIIILAIVTASSPAITIDVWLTDLHKVCSFILFIRFFFIFLIIFLMFSHSRYFDYFKIVCLAFLCPCSCHICFPFLCSSPFLLLCFLPSRLAFPPVSLHGLSLLLSLLTVKFLANFLAFISPLCYQILYFQPLHSLNFKSSFFLSLPPDRIFKESTEGR